MEGSGLSFERDKDDWHLAVRSFIQVISHSLLPRDAMLSAVYAVVVCLSVTLRYCIKTAKRRIMQIMSHDRVFKWDVL